MPKFGKTREFTEIHFIKTHKFESEMGFEKGMIEAWRHIRHVCNGCIKAHKEEMKRIKKEDKWK